LPKKRENWNGCKPIGTLNIALIMLLFPIAKCTTNTAKTDSAPFATLFAKQI